VVGDDDQAIFKFQGADLSNVEVFEAAYRDPEIIPLEINYRSNQPIIDCARTVNSQIAHSFQKLKGMEKPLHVTVETDGCGVELHEFAHESQHYAWIAHEIKRLIDSKTVQGSEIAVLARERGQLDAMVPYLRALQIPIDYERRENILEQLHVVALLNLARLVHALSRQDLHTANQLLPAVLSHPMWAIDPAKLWHISTAAYREKKFWLDVLYEQGDPELKQIADFLLKTAGQAATLPLEQVLDLLIGTDAARAADTEQEGEDTEAATMQVKAFISPFRTYYFPDASLEQRPTEYLTLLSHLSTLRNKLRTYQTAAGKVLYLDSCLDFIDSYQRAELLMLDKAPHREDVHAVKLMTTHKAKGLEFDAVFVIGTQDEIWQKSGNNNRFSYPMNLRDIKQADNDMDDALRLLFVALTRARQNLYVCYYKQSEEGKESQAFAPLLGFGLEAKAHDDMSIDPAALALEYEEKWLQRHASVPMADRKALLAERLGKYQLSATHFNNFLNVTEGGPLYFLTQNLLHFPSSLNTSAVYGTAMHRALRFAQQQVASGKRLNDAQVIDYFTEELAVTPLPEREKAAFTAKGKQALQQYLTVYGNTLSAEQKTEFDFTDQGVVVDGARLKGAIDLIDSDADSQTVIVTDYKTGKAFSKWELPPSAETYDRVKLHKYRQQLLFYKLLVDGSADLGRRGWTAVSGRLRFIEPDQYGKIRELSVTYETEELERLKQLIKVVWQHIMELNFPDSSHYSPDLKGVKAFEQDLLDGKI
jgi:DNA helicase-2/ATP-dependent DNA helicase PcrA